jgi:hypothetical protein
MAWRIDLDHFITLLFVAAQDTGRFDWTAHTAMMFVLTPLKSEIN